MLETALSCGISVASRCPGLPAWHFTRFLFVNRCGVAVPLILEGRQIDAESLQVLLACAASAAAGAEVPWWPAVPLETELELHCMLTWPCLVMLFHLGISADGIFF